MKFDEMTNKQKGWIQVFLIVLGACGSIFFSLFILSLLNNQ